MNSQAGKEGREKLTWHVGVWLTLLRGELEIIGAVNLWATTRATWAIRRIPYLGSAGSVSKPRDRGFRKDDNSRRCCWVLSVRAMGHGPWITVCSSVFVSLFLISSWSANWVRQEIAVMVMERAGTQVCVAEQIEPYQNDWLFGRPRSR